MCVFKLLERVKFSMNIVYLQGMVCQKWEGRGTKKWLMSHRILDIENFIYSFQSLLTRTVLFICVLTLSTSYLSCILSKQYPFWDVWWVVAHVKSWVVGQTLCRPLFHFAWLNLLYSKKWKTNIHVWYHQLACSSKALNAYF